MDDIRTLIASMAVECRGIIRESHESDLQLPTALHPKYLLWMCQQITIHVADWPVTKLHRWIGFIQGGILANRMLDLDGVRAMFTRLPQAATIASDDADLIDHLDTENSFELDLGGQG